MKNHMALLLQWRRRQLRFALIYGNLNLLCNAVWGLGSILPHPAKGRGFAKLSLALVCTVCFLWPDEILDNQTSSMTNVGRSV